MLVIKVWLQHGDTLTAVLLSLLWCAVLLDTHVVFPTQCNFPQDKNLHDGMPPHFDRNVAEYLNWCYGNCWTDMGGLHAWLPHFPDLTPLDLCCQDTRRNWCISRHCRYETNACVASCMVPISWKHMDTTQIALKWTCLCVMNEGGCFKQQAFSVHNLCHSVQFTLRMAV
jgi:hypothetical protein